MLACFCAIILTVEIKIKIMNLIKESRFIFLERPGGEGDVVSEQAENSADKVGERVDELFGDLEKRSDILAGRLMREADDLLKGISEDPKGLVFEEADLGKIFDVLKHTNSLSNPKYRPLLIAIIKHPKSPQKALDLARLSPNNTLKNAYYARARERRRPS
jgi:hypothetical protein